MPVVIKQWKFGERVTIRIIAGEGDGLLITGINEATGEGFILAGDDQSVKPEIGKSYVLEFTKGGPMGGYWKIIEEER
jgi:hypothetical protein